MKSGYCFILLLICITYCLGYPQQSLRKGYAQLLYNGKPTYLSCILLSEQKKLSLSIDRIDAGYEILSYTFQLCNKQWERVNDIEMSYIQIDGLLELNQYQQSLTQYTSYIHYHKKLLEEATILKSGNYQFIVHNNNNLDDVIYQTRIVFVENILKTSIQIDNSRYGNNETQPTHLVQVTVETPLEGGGNQYLESDLSVMIVQNGSWTRSFFMPPNPVSTGSKKTYGAMGDVGITSMGYYRLLNANNLRMNSSHRGTAILAANDLHVSVSTDAPYFISYTYPYNNLPGYSIVQSEQGHFDPALSAEYAWFHLQFDAPLSDKKLYVVGHFNQYQLKPDYQMTYNPIKKQYEIALWLKQGSHQYAYVIPDKQHIYIPYHSKSNNATKAPHIYTALVYASMPHSKAERVVGYASIKTY